MSKLGNIQESYGKQITIAIAGPTTGTMSKIAAMIAIEIAYGFCKINKPTAFTTKTLNTAIV